MIKIGVLKNTVQNYAWGSPTAIAQLLGKENRDEKPMAELWMGSHPKAPSQVKWDGQWRSLGEVIEKTPQLVLGSHVVQIFGNRLPFLFKVLAAARPLSIQAHPNRDQAREGFERENRAGIPLDAFNRNYKDDNHKPEIICALSSFWALCGFRQIPDILALTGEICPNTLAVERAALKNHPDSKGLKTFFSQLMGMEPGLHQRVLDEAVGNARRRLNEDPVMGWMARLSDEYPGDIGIFTPVLLNLIELKTGQALFLPAGELHAYLEGVGIELMANSDNVLRGGLTSKHIDVAELLRVLNFEPRPLNVLEAVETDANEKVYTEAADEFVLSVIRVETRTPYRSFEDRSVEIILCTQGQARIENNGATETLDIKKGTSVIIPAAVKNYRIIGQGTFYKAAVPRNPRAPNKPIRFFKRTSGATP